VDKHRLMNRRNKIPSRLQEDFSSCPDKLTACAIADRAHDILVGAHEVRGIITRLPSLLP
jgi:hypothetical protein